MKRKLDGGEEGKPVQSKRERIDNSISEKINEVESELLNYIKDLKASIREGGRSRRDQKVPTPINKDSSKECCPINTREKDGQKELVDEAKEYLKNTERLQNIKSYAAGKKGEASKEDLRTLKKEVEALKSDVAKAEAETEDIETKKLPALQRNIAKQTEENRKIQESLDLCSKQEAKLNTKKRAFNEVNEKLTHLSKKYDELKDKISKVKSVSDNFGGE